MSHSPDGYEYGIRFPDRKVLFKSWRRDIAEDDLKVIQASPHAFPIGAGSFLVRRLPRGPWEEVDAHACKGSSPSGQRESAS